jgi:hypothetical protein
MYTIHQVNLTCFLNSQACLEMEYLPLLGNNIVCTSFLFSQHCLLHCSFHTKPSNISVIEKSMSILCEPWARSWLPLILRRSSWPSPCCALLMFDIRTSFLLRYRVPSRLPFSGLLLILWFLLRCRILSKLVRVWLTLQM